jgi:hypothetical protein
MAASRQNLIAPIAIRSFAQRSAVGLAAPGFKSTFAISYPDTSSYSPDIIGAPSGSRPKDANASRYPASLCSLVHNRGGPPMIATLRCPKEMIILLPFGASPGNAQDQENVVRLRGELHTFRH